MFKGAVTRTTRTLLTPTRPATGNASGVLTVVHARKSETKNQKAGMNELVRKYLHLWKLFHKTVIRTQFVQNSNYNHNRLQFCLWSFNFKIPFSSRLGIFL